MSWSFRLSQAEQVPDYVRARRSYADVIGNRITLRTSFEYLFHCRRFPGAEWDSQRRVWTYPATNQHACLIQSWIANLDISEGFASLLTRVEPKTFSVEIQNHMPIPPCVQTTPWRHQVDTFKFAMDCLLNRNGAAMLALEMGTGKTLVALMVLAALAARRVLICCPLRVIPVWVDQIKRHLASFGVVAALDESIGGVAGKKAWAAEKLRLAQATNTPFVAIINYESVWREPFCTWAEEQEWDLAIADESHRIKRPGGKASLYFRRLRARTRYRLALTGTPMPHSPLDVYAQFRFLDTGVFGTSFSIFRSRFAVMGGCEGKEVLEYQNLDELEALMRTMTYRVAKDVLDLPPETHVTYHCELTAEARRIYSDLADDFIAKVQDGRITSKNALVTLLRLQQIVGGSVKTDDGQYHRVNSAKQALLVDTLQDIGPAEPVVVFCRFRRDLDAVHEATKSAGFSSLELSGRRDELRRWQDGEAQVLAVQISAGGVGIDLTRARYSIYYSLSFSLGEYDQALSRVHCPGQTRPVEHIHLVARNTVDEDIVRALRDRAEVVEAILAKIKA